MARKKVIVTRSLRRTLFLVGEGLHEQAFLTHIKKFLAHDAGPRITITNAKGGGAQHVIEWTIRQMTNKHYDQVAVLVDTDTDYTETAIKLAKKSGIEILSADPCLEALLLRVMNRHKVPNDWKKEFNRHIPGERSAPETYQIFSLETLQKKRADEKTIDDLLRLLVL